MKIVEKQIHISSKLHVKVASFKGIGVTPSMLIINETNVLDVCRTVGISLPMKIIIKKVIQVYSMERVLSC